MFDIKFATSSHCRMVKPYYGIYFRWLTPLLFPNRSTNSCDGITHLSGCLTPPASHKSSLAVSIYLQFTGTSCPTNERIEVQASNMFTLVSSIIQLSNGESQFQLVNILCVGDPRKNTTLFRIPARRLPEELHVVKRRWLSVAEG